MNIKLIKCANIFRVTCVIINSANRSCNSHDSNCNLCNRSNRRTNHCLNINELILIYIDYQQCYDLLLLNLI